MADEVPGLPPIGSHIMLPVVQAPTRTTLFPEQVIIASLGSDAIELIFIRSELQVAFQQGVVSRHSGEQADVQVTSSPVSTQPTDIGHVRLSRQAAMDMLLNLARHMLEHAGVRREDLIAELTAEPTVAK